MASQTRKRKVGVLTFSDGRKDVYDSLLALNRQFQDRLKKSLERTGEFEVTAGEIIGDARQAKLEAKKMKAAGVEATVLNIPVWIFPSFPVIAANDAPGPYLLFSDLNPKYPGHGGNARDGWRLRHARHTIRACLGRYRGPGRTKKDRSILTGFHLGKSPERGDLRAVRREAHGHVYGGRRPGPLAAMFRHRRGAHRPVGDRPQVRG